MTLAVAEHQKAAGGLGGPFRASDAATGVAIRWGFAFCGSILSSLALAYNGAVPFFSDGRRCCLCRGWDLPRPLGMFQQLSRPNLSYHIYGGKRIVSSSGFIRGKDEASVLERRQD